MRSMFSHHTVSLADVILVFSAEKLDAARNRTSGGISQGTERLAADIVADVRQQSVETSAGPEMYLLVTQSGPEGGELVVRSKLPPETLTPTIMQTLRSLNPSQPAAELQPIDRIVEQTGWQPCMSWEQSVADLWREVGDRQPLKPWSGAMAGITERLPLTA